MKTMTLSKRTAKEILRDPIYMGFGIGFPLGVMFLLSAIQSNLPIEIFTIEKLTPGIVVFGLSFMSLYAAVLVSKDQSTALLQRLYTTPLTSSDYIISYIVPILPIAFAQTSICYMAAMLLGLKFSMGVIYAMLCSIPIALFFISLGLLIGVLFNDKQAGGICGPILTNIAAWLSGAWIDLNLIGGGFEQVANALPFVHAVDIQRDLLAQQTHELSIQAWWILGYTILVLVLAILAFMRKMKHL